MVPLKGALDSEWSEACQEEAVVCSLGHLKTGSCFRACAPWGKRPSCRLSCFPFCGVGMCVGVGGWGGKRGGES